MVDFAHSRRWWPACLVDEIMPPGRERPEDWLSPDAAPIQFIPCSGALGFFEWERGRTDEVPEAARWMRPSTPPASPQGSLL